MLLDALEPHVPHDAAERVLASALGLAGVEGPPAVGPELRTFVEGHLVDALEAALGPEAADAFEESVDQIMRAAALEHESAPPPRGADLGHLVLVATAVPARSEAIQHALVRHANVEMVADPATLTGILWARLASVLIVDYGSCPLPNHALEEMAAAASSHTRVLLWGAPKYVEAVFSDASGGTWISCSAMATPVHVAQLALALTST